MSRDDDTPISVVCKRHGVTEDIYINKKTRKGRCRLCKIMYAEKFRGPKPKEKFDFGRSILKKSGPTKLISQIRRPKPVYLNEILELLGHDPFRNNHG